MSESEGEENYIKHHHRKHKRHDSGLDFNRECKKKHRSHKRRISDRNDDSKRRKIKSVSKDYIKVKSEPKDKYEKSCTRTESKADCSRERKNFTEPSGSKRHLRAEHQDDTGDACSHHDWGDSKNKEKPSKSKTEIQKPNFGLSGKLAEDTNVFNGVVIKYSEPPEARMPKKRWRLYPFKGDQGLPTLYIHRQSAYLLGRDRKVADIPIDHPSCSKQHAALQYRLVSYQRADGSMGKQIRLYLIDLESANGTYINNNKIESRKYVELFEKDVLKFGFSSREYVLLHEHSKDNEESENESQV